MQSLREIAGDRTYVIQTYHKAHSQPKQTAQMTLCSGPLRSQLPGILGVQDTVIGRCTCWRESETASLALGSVVSEVVAMDDESLLFLTALTHCVEVLSLLHAWVCLHTYNLVQMLSWMQSCAWSLNNPFPNAAHCHDSVSCQPSFATCEGTCPTCEMTAPYTKALLVLDLNPGAAVVGNHIHFH